MSDKVHIGQSAFRRSLRATIGMGAVSAVLLGTQPVYAQTAPGMPASTSIVSACSGVSLPKSVVTDIMSPVITGVVGPLEGTVNGLLGILVPQLNINTTQLLSNAAAGQPITLSALNLNGTVVGGGPCYSQAAGYSLSTAGGIAIGGNQITGLGSGTAALSGENNSIAFGNGSVTAANALGAIALGTNAKVDTGAVGGVAFGNDAQVTAAGGVALGANSLASRAPGNYTAAFLIGTQTSVGDVSVGASGSLRQITNVAPGSSANDAVNVAQLQAVSDGGLKYDTVARTVATLSGAGGTTITNLRAGTLTAGSSDAVNGSQLFATNSNVTNNTTAITNINNTLANAGVGILRYADPALPTTPNGGAATQDVTLVGGAAGSVKLHNVGAGTVASGSTDAVNGGQIFALNGQVDLLENLAVQYDDGTQAQITLGGAGNNAPAVVLTNVAAGTLDATSRDAVNGSQLFATNTTINNLSTQVGNGSVGTVQFSNFATPTTPNGGIPGQDMTLVGATVGAPVRLHNIANGSVQAGSTDAVNGGQLFATNSQINLLNGLAVRYDDGSQSQITLGGAGNGAAPVRIANVAGGTLNATSTDAVNGSQLFATNSAVTINNTAITNLQTQTQNGGIGPVQYSSAGSLTTPNGGMRSQDLTLVGLNAGASVRLHNVADGAVASGSTDAVNGGQLFALNSQIGTLGGLAVQYDDSSKAGVTFGGTGAPAVTLDNVAAGALNASSSEAVNGAQLYATNQAVAGNSTDITNLGNIVNQYGVSITNNSNAITLLESNIDNGAIGPLRYSDPGTPTTPNGGTKTNDVTLVGANAGRVRLHNVADGLVAAGSGDGVNGGQLYDLTTQIGSLNGLAVQYDDSSKAQITFGGTGNPSVVLTNVAAGTIGAGSTDAVNGGQLNDTNINVANNRIQLGSLSSTVTSNTLAITNTNLALGDLSTNVANGGIGPVQYSSAGSPEAPNGGIPSQDLTLIGASAGPVGLHNIFAGRLAAGSLDAVNGGQLYNVGGGVAAAFGSNFTFNPTTSSFAGNFNFGGGQYSNVQDVFSDIYNTLATGPTSNTASKYFHTTSIDADSQAMGADSSAIGPNAIATGEASIASGRDSQAMGDGSVAIGDGATAALGKAVSIGFGNTASGDGSVAIGDPNVATGEGAIALGKDNTATGDGAIALGNTNSANGIGSVGLGLLNVASGEGAVAIGERNEASGDGAFAVGSTNEASGHNALAIGSNNIASGNGSLVIGRGIVNNSDDTLAIGAFASVNDIDSIAIGNRATSGAARSTAVGNDTVAWGQESTALGDGAMATGLRSTALGSSAVVTGLYGVAVGESSTVGGFGGTAIGLLSQANAYASTALGSGAIADDEGSVALGSASGTTRGAVANYSAFGLDTTQTSLGEIAVARNLSYADPNNGNALTPTGNRQITGVSAGSEGTDAVNISQLHGVSDNLGSMLAYSLGGGAIYNSATGKVTGPSYTLNGVTYDNVGAALAAYAAGGGSANAVTYDDPTHSTATLDGAGGTTVNNVAEGNVNAGSTDAVNGSQLNATNVRVTQNETAITNLTTQVTNGAVGTVQYANAATPTTPNGGTKTNDLTLVGAQQAPVALHNVADGQVEAGSTDAVNGGQLATVQDTATRALTINQRSVSYDDDNRTAITLGGGSGDGDDPTPVALHNVADGVSGRDAVNVSQLNSGLTSAVEQANDYTDTRIAALSFDLRRVSRDANAGTAGALAAAGMPQAYEAGRGMLAFGAGTFQGQSAMAFGFSKASGDGRTVVKLGATYNSRGHVGANAGIGWQL